MATTGTTISMLTMAVDWIKAEVKLFTKSFQLETVNWRNKQIKRLQRKRNKILRHQKHRGIVDWTLPIVEKQLGALQEEAAEIDALRAGKRWREKGEKKARSDLRDPVSGELCEDQEAKEKIVQQFYSKLHTPGPPNYHAMNRLIAKIPNNVKLNDSQRDTMMLSISMNEILKNPSELQDKVALAPMVVHMKF
ncbi:uncharacterized protein B0P05DRAFT_584083 [Gilbertella persicaria]|uniref:uncharacterized protein n=1 Tax=Gilbertella persicaria TaxID=101096 RepID=UPI00221FD4B2|nr:uncharacterized protein B0P05DRAFT_584083 [Gilbertella persicaria]KAI8090962.1 hypothetical protein B0P05DRAFT_584083 [Gilbertella persicaria]